MATRDKYSIFALLFILLAEVATVAAIRLSIGWWLWIVSGIAVLAIAIVLAMGKRNGFDFRPKSGVASNLLANAITPRAISAFYLLFFVVHIGWVSDSTLNLFLPKEYTDWAEIVVSLVVGYLGLLSIIVFFPRSEDKQGKNKIIISGISIPSVPYIDPKTNPTEDEKYRSLNLRPLVRPLQLLSDDENECSMLILWSNGLDKALPVNFPKVYKLITGKDYEGDTKDLGVKGMADLLIRECAIKEFPDKKDMISKLTIRWTKDSCDYDDFGACFSTLNNEINGLTDKDHSLIFNMTPGTALIGGVITLLAMDPQRSLYYYRQSKEITDDKDRLQPVVKDYESIRTLLSGTLENIRRKES